MEIFAWAALLMGMLLGAFLGRRRTRLEEASPSKPAVHHESEVADIRVDILAEAIEEHAQHDDVDPETVRNVIDLADATRGPQGPRRRF